MLRSSCSLIRPCSGSSRGIFINEFVSLAKHNAKIVNFTECAASFQGFVYKIKENDSKGGEFLNLELNKDWLK